MGPMSDNENNNNNSNSNSNSYSNSNSNSNSNNNNNSNNDNNDKGAGTIKADITATTEKITNYLSDKVDDAKHQLEAGQRKFEISGEGSKLDRKKAEAQMRFDKEVVDRPEETKEGLQNALGIGINENDVHRNGNENQSRKVGEGDLDGCGASDNFSCSNGCGLFST